MLAILTIFVCATIATACPGEFTVPMVKKDWIAHQIYPQKVYFFCSVWDRIFECPTPPPEYSWIQFLSAMSGTVSLKYPILLDCNESYSLELQNVGLFMDADPDLRQNGTFSVHLGDSILARYRLDASWNWQNITLPVSDPNQALTFQFSIEEFRRTLTRLIIGNIELRKM
jgi:hypothetical protein